MKKSRLLQMSLAIFALMPGCRLEEVHDWGMRCPPDDLEEHDETPLEYIDNPECTADNLEGCDTSEMAYKDMSLYFRTKNCPPEYKICAAHELEDGGYGYHCEVEETAICVQGKVCKKDDGEKFCLDPSRTMTCGATDCKADAPTYGGQDCSVLHAKCDEVAPGVFGCVSQETGELVCGNDFIDPSDEAFCGANDCNADNYGGEDCSIYGDDSICSRDAETHLYRCQCRKNTILCGNQCIRPKYDDEYCGARGSCSEDDFESENYIGQNCVAGDGYCKNEACQCAGDELWCIIEGMNDDKPRCYSPFDNESCAAKMSEDGIHCDVTPCTGRYQCLNVSRNTYECSLAECDDGELLCYTEDTKECYSKFDPHHCGNCSKDCDAHNYENAVTKVCAEQEGGTAACVYECKPGYTNCSSEYSPICVNTMNSSKHCNGCNIECPAGSYCQDGECQLTDCAGNECTTHDANNTKICVNLPEKCGKDCKNCNDIQTGSNCVQGECVVGACNAGTHPVYNNNGQITNCIKNTAESCAPTNMANGETPVNCAQKFSGHVKTADCSPSGQCYIKECESGYRLDDKKTVCYANNEMECGTPSSSTTRNCKAIEHVDSVTCNNDGTCTVNSCTSGFHPNKNRTACDQTNETSCADTGSNSPISCITAGVKSATCTNGKCKVTSCTSNSYHINSSYTGCEGNTDTACGTATTTGTNCQNNPAKKKCKTSQGVCACSTDGSTVVNYDGNACVPAICDGVPGVAWGEFTTYNYMGQSEPGACKPTSCVSGYTLETIGDGAVCHPTTTSLCSSIGYLNPTISGSGYCRACTTSGSCSASACSENDKFFMASCLPADACCGSRTYGSNKFYTCTNCLYLGKHCNTSSGNCE